MLGNPIVCMNGPVCFFCHVLDHLLVVEEPSPTSVAFVERSMDDSLGVAMR